MDSGKDTRLGAILLQLDYVHKQHIDEALEIQPVRAKRIGEILMELGYVEEDHVLEALSQQFDIPFEADLEGEIDEALAAKVPITFIRENEMAPFRRNGESVHVAVHDPVNLLPLGDLQLLLNSPVTPFICRKKDIQQIIDGYFSQQGVSATDMIDSIAGDDEEGLLSLDGESSERDLLDLANEAPIIKLINLMISGAVRERASDIHIEPFEREVSVRYRIDGVLYEKLTVPKSQQAAVVSRIKIMAKLNIAEQRLPQDGRIKILLSGKEIDIRVSSVPIQHGERVVMRILEKGNFLFGLEELGMGKRDYTAIDKVIRNSHGIILVTGPTGSGKSTTLYSALQRVLSPDINVITVEDPVEYQMKGVGQIEVKPKIGLTFASALRSILRQDPDVILVGEIRDQETAEMAVHASLTGHLVFSTLHTNDSAGALTRLVNMGIEPFLVTSSTIAILAQRLVRRICDHCKNEFVPDIESLNELGQKALKFKDQVAYHADGCVECQHRGYFGRTGIFELMMMTPEIQEMTLRGVDSNAIKREARRGGMYSLRDDGTEKVFQGVTSIEEVLRVTRDDFLGEIPD
jgi:general secretion pathway protein E